MPARTRPARVASNSRRSTGEPRPDNRLALLDHAFFAWQHATGERIAIQVVWVYEHCIDFDALRRFHRNLGQGLLGRRIERSPLPFARHRWVADRQPLDIEYSEHTRPRAELSDWADERAQLPTDPELGPGWHLGVVFLEDGATAVSLVVSHYLVDGLGVVVAIADAIMGNGRNLALPPPVSRTRWRAAGHDARELARDASEIAHAFGVGTRMARRYWPERARAVSAARRAGALEKADGIKPDVPDAPDETVVVPAVTLHIDLDDWNARAAALGGTRNTLVAGLAAKLGERMGRQRDGLITLQLPMSERAEGDTRANAMSIARAKVDPTEVTKDLRGVRVAVKDALTSMQQTPDEVQELLWLLPFRPRWALRRSANATATDPDLPVFCSNLGDLGSIISRIDGTPAEKGTGRATWHHITRGWLERTGGLLRMQAWRINDWIGISVVAYQPGADNTKPALRELAAQVLTDFELTGDID